MLGPSTLRPDTKAEPPVLVRSVMPKYPEDLRKEGISGIVTVSCVVDDKGDVQDASVVKTTHPAFSAPALEAVSKWKFKPAKENGAPVAKKVMLPLHFKVDE